MMNISNIKDAINITSRLNPRFGQLALSISPSDNPDKVEIDTSSKLCNIELCYKDSLATTQLELANKEDVNTFISLVGEDNLTSLGNYESKENKIFFSNEFPNLLAATGWLINCSIKLKELVDKISDRLSIIGDPRKKYLIVICPKQYEAIELLMAKDKLPESHKEGQHIIGSHRYSMSGEGFRAESKLIYMTDLKPILKVYDGSKLIFYEEVQLAGTEDSRLSLEKEITISPLPATVVVERRRLFEGDFKYELFLKPDEKFDVVKLKLYENSSSEFDPDCYDGLSLDKIKYGEEILPLINRNNYGTWQARYFFGTLYAKYIDFIDL